VGDGGWCQLLDAGGAPLNTPQPVLGGAAARAVSWDGESFVVVGDSGRLQRVNAAGQVQADTLLSYGSMSWRGLASGGGVSVLVRLNIPNGRF
jgi:hypothetical protein